MRIRSALVCLVALATPVAAHAQDVDTLAPLPLRVLDVATAAPVSSAEIFLPSGALLTLGDAQGFVSIPAHAADSVFLAVRAAGYDADTLFPPFGQELLLRPAGRAIEEIVVRPDAVVAVTPSRRDAVIDYTFAGEYILLATARSARKTSLLLLSPRGDTVAHTPLREEPDGLFTACDGTPYAIFSQRFQPVTAAAAQLHLGQRYPRAALSRVQACALQLDGALYYKSFSPETFSLRLWRWAAADTAPKLIAERTDADAAHSTRPADWLVADNIHLWHRYGYASPQAAALQVLQNRLARQALDGNLMLLHDTLLLPDFRGRALLHYTAAGTALRTVPLRFGWGKATQFSLIQDAATGRIFLHRYGRPQAQTVQELDPHTGSLTGREVRIEKAHAHKVQVRAGRLYYLWQDDRVLAAQQLFTQPLATGR